MVRAPAADIQQEDLVSGTSGSAANLQHTGAPLTQAASQKDVEQTSSKTDPKTKMKNLFGLGKKKLEEKMAKAPATAEASLPSPPPEKNLSPHSSRRSTAASPPLSDAHHVTPSSRPRRSSKLASPAGSQIFERDVQESTLAMPNSPAIPSHIQVEDHIPPVLDATSEAITDRQLDPDSVEIITHASHQPASVTVGGISSCDNSPPNCWTDELAALVDREESASNYGSLDASDVRRLSFISFADVVQAEHHGQGVQGAAGSRDSVHHAALTSFASAGVNSSPSPMRSPVSSQGPDLSPPTSKSGSIKGLEMSPKRRPLGSPASTQQHVGLHSTGDLNIETMSQAVRRTQSTDLSASRGSLPASPI